MGISITFDDLVNRMYLSRSKIVNLGSEVWRKIPSLIGLNSPQGSPNQGGETPKVIKTSWSEELGYLVNMDSFPRRYFSDPVIELTDYSDRRNKEIHREDSRKMGGIYDNHPLDILREHYKITAQIAPAMIDFTGLSLDQVLTMFLDHRFVIAGKGHDDFEDHKRLREPLANFKDALKRAIQRDPKLIERTSVYDEMMDLRDTVKRIRGEIVEEEHSLQTAFIDSIGLHGKERSRLIIDADFAMGVKDWSARHIEDNFFTQSMFRLRQRYTLEDYVKNGRGGPFQEKLMKELGVRGEEPIEYQESRIYLRALDRIVLSRERKPRYTKPQAREMEGLFSKYQLLRDVFGDGIQFRVEEGMSRPELLDTLYRNDVVLSNMDSAIKSYGSVIVKQQKRNPTALWYLLAILKARDYLIAENGNIIAELKSSYQRDLGRKAKEIEDYVATLPPQEFEIVTGEGPISNGFRYETGMRTNIETTERQIIENYDDVLRFERLNFNFSDPQRNIVDLKRGKFDLFVVGGLKDGISFYLHPTPTRRV